jgi:hypothetical protein
VDRIAKGMEHVLVGDSVLPSALGDDGLHRSQVTLSPSNQQVNLWPPHCHGQTNPLGNEHL